MRSTSYEPHEQIIELREPPLFGELFACGGDVRQSRHVARQEFVFRRRVLGKGVDDGLRGLLVPATNDDVLVRRIRHNSTPRIHGTSSSQRFLSYSVQMPLQHPIL